MLAKVSAAMEAIETYHAENDCLKVISASYHTFRKEADVIDPKRLNLHPQTVYHDQMTISWVEGYDLIQEKKVFVPYDLVHLKFLKGHTPMPIFTQGSNGLASGNHILEAISHAICEVVERDATALWELSRFKPEEDETIIDLDTIESEACQKLIDMIHRAGLIVYMTNQTSNVGIPSFGCVITEGRPAGMKFRHGSSGGFGCHLSKEIALLRAVTEAAQSRLTHISGARDDMYRIVYQVQQQSSSNFKHWKEVTENSRATLDFRTLPSLETNSLEEDVAVQLELLKKVGLNQAIMIDLTDPNIGIPVVKVIIPGAEYRHTGFHKRFGQRAREQTLRAIINKRFYSEFI
jgi:ribosomal protein S12 methylthiotransferase accessory factor